MDEDLVAGTPSVLPLPLALVQTHSAVVGLFYPKKARSSLSKLGMHRICELAYALQALILLTLLLFAYAHDQCGGAEVGVRDRQQCVYEHSIQTRRACFSGLL